MTATRGSANVDGRESTTNDTNTLQRAISALEKMKARLDASERMASEPIAIVGMACHFPGDGEGLEAFWRVLDQGIDTVREIPPERWPTNAIRGDRQETRWAALLNDISAFDANFFGISPREAETLDPQQRLLLEVTWEALEDGGQRPDLLFGSRTGVFIGICSSDYRHLVSDRRAEQYDAYCTTGNMLCTAAGRISFALGFQGPALSIETGCSSSLVAIAQGCQSLRARDSDVVVAGGVNALLSATIMAMVAETQALSPDGRCKTLDARANGIVRGEGCGMIVLKRLSDALRDGDRIRGLIRGWAVNQDGRSTGLTTPNVLSQQAMLRHALERARLSPADIDYVELHGTGTSLGDPIEAEALREVFGAPRSDGSTCVLGAVKTNIGHTEGAAGAAGIIKILLALQHERIPKNLHFKRLNPRISLDGTPLVIPIEPRPWLRTKRPRRAGVNSFGISGTNAHVIVEEPPQEERSAPIPSASGYLLPLSAKTPQALTALAKSYAEWFSQESDASLYDIAYTAGARRTHHEHRLAVVAQTREEFATILSSVARGETVVGTSRSSDTRLTNTKVVFVFPGQGSQWLGMGGQLLAEESVFRVAIESCDAAIRKESGFSVLEELAADEHSSRIGEIDVVQPVLFAIEVGLAALWRSWGIEPDCVIGHSMGEVAAAHVAGALSLADAAAIICRRSRLLRKVSGRGAMAVVELTAADAESAIAAYPNRLSVAVCNGPRSTVIAGDSSTLDEVLGKLERNGVFCQRIKVDVASHTPQMDAVYSDVVEALSSIRPTGLHIPMRSTTTGGQVRGEELAATYWADNLRRPVLFSQVVAQLIEDTHTIFLEISPHPILLAFIEENLREKNVDGAVLSSLRYGRDERKSLFESFGTLYTNGYGADWRKLYPLPGRVISLPAYPWQRENFG